MVASLQSLGIWSRKYTQCTDCGKTERPHQAKGLCETCYYKHYLESHRKEYIDAALRWQQRNKEKVNAYKRNWNKKKRNSL